MEPQFYAQLLALTGLDAARAAAGAADDEPRWPETTERLAAIFKTKTRDEWVAAAEPYDACLTPVLDFSEVPEHPHIRARGTFTTVNGAVQPAPAPRFSRTPGRHPATARDAGRSHRRGAARMAGNAGHRGGRLRAGGAVL